jgi:hypothetical protein
MRRHCNINPYRPNCKYIYQLLGPSVTLFYIHEFCMILGLNGDDILKQR